MIEARHSAPFQTAFGAYASRLLARNFHALWCRGNLPDIEGPMVLVVQHVAWWDPLVMLHLARAHFPRPARNYTMMDAANLRRMRFFRWVGAFGVDRSSRGASARAVRYALGVLAAAPRTRLVIFPQGRQRPMDVRPLGCEPGAGFVAARAGAVVVPIALRYEFLEERFADAFVSIGEARAVERGRDGERGIEAALTAVADALRDDIHAGRFDRYVRLLRGRGHRGPK